MEIALCVKGSPRRRNKWKRHSNHGAYSVIWECRQGLLCRLRLVSFCWGVEVVGEVLTFPLGNGPWQRHDQTFPEFELCVLRQLLGQNKRIPTEIYLYLEGMNFLFFFWSAMFCAVSLKRGCVVLPFFSKSSIVLCVLLNWALRLSFLSCEQ